MYQSGPWVNGSWVMGQMGHINGWVRWVMGHGFVTHDPLPMGQWVTMVTHDSSEMLMNCICLRVSIAVSNSIIENSNGDYSSNMCSEKQIVHNYSIN